MTKRDSCLFCNATFGSAEERINDRHSACHIEYEMVKKIRKIAKTIFRKARWLWQAKAISLARSFKNAREMTEKMLLRLEKLKASALKKLLGRIGFSIKQLGLLVRLEVHLPA